MFSNGVTLSRSHWSFKLLQFTFPSLDRFYNFCPHFWLTVLCIMILPLTLVWKGFTFISIKLGQGIMWVSDRIDKSMQLSRTAKYNTMTDLERMWGMYYLSNRWDLETYIKLYFPRKEARDIKRWGRCVRAALEGEAYWALRSRVHMEDDPSMVIILARIDEIKSKVYLMRKREIERDEKFRTRIFDKTWWKGSVATLMLLAKILGWTISIAAILVGSYCLIFIIGWVWYWICWFFSHGPVMTVLQLILSTIGIIVGVLLVAWLFVKIWEITERPLKSFFSFTWKGVKMFKENNCPEIHWVD